MAEPYENEGPEGYGLEDELDGLNRSTRGWLPGVMTVAIAIVAIGGFAGVLVYAYNKGKEVGSTTIPPIIKAGPAPHKIRPENPGGMNIPHRDKDVYSQLAGNSPPRKSTRKVERLLPMPEAPVAPPAPVKKVMQAPKKIKMPPPPPVVKSIPKPPPNVKPRRVANAGNAAGHATDARPVPVTRASQKTTRATARKLAAIAPATGGSTRVQLLSLRSENAVRKAWKGLQKRHGDLLGRLSLTVQRRNLGVKKGVYYRLQAGPLANVASAKALCSKLNKRKMGCLIVRR
jgi:hypothetical protein